jgi:hypothetical protein
MEIPAEASELFEKLAQQKVILFIGNGASVDAGGPTTEKIVAQIKARFKDASYSSEDFIQTCTDLMETTLTSRKDLEALIVKALYDLKPSPFHMELPLSIWPAIFTTNYDDLIEKAYRLVDSRVQLADPVFSAKGPFGLHDIEKVKIFKVMGCITSQHPDNKLILTREDYNSVLKTRPVLFNILRDIMRDGTILYVGYSFRDYLLSDIFSELIQTVGLQNLPYSYALTPDIVPTSVQATKLRELRQGEDPIQLLSKHNFRYKLPRPENKMVRIVSLDREDVESLLIHEYMINDDWMKARKLRIEGGCRKLKNLAVAFLEQGYFRGNWEDTQLKCYRKWKDENTLQGKIAGLTRTLVESVGSEMYEIVDGWGRLLPYAALIYEGFEFHPVETFLATSK